MGRSKSKFAPDLGRSWVVPFIATVFAMIALQMSNLGFSPLLPDIQTRFHMSYSQVGLFTGVYGIVGIVLSVPAGLLARAYGEKAVMVAGLGTVTAGLLVLAAAPNFDLALGGRVIWISGYRFGFVCAMMAVALTAPPRWKGSTMGIVGAVSSLASVVGAPFGSEMGKTFGWRAGIAGYACFALAGVLIFALLYRRVFESGVVAPHGAPIGASPSATPAHRVPVVWIMAGGIGLLNMGSFTITFFVPLVVKSIFRLTPTDAAYMISAAYFAAIFANLACGYLADRLGHVKVMIGLAALLIAASCGMMSTDLLIFRIAVILVVSLGISSTNQGYATVGAVLKGREVGPAMGIVSLGSGVYAYAGPQMVGFLRDWTGSFRAGFYVLVGAAAVGLALMVTLKYIEDRRKVSSEAACALGAGK